jgi:hypothetical protein
MPYVYRDAQGAIAAVYDQPVDGGEEVAVDDPALTAFIQKNLPTVPSDEWVQSDLALARVMEDLIEILIDKKVLMFTDFPEGAQKKLLERRGFRKEFSYVDGLFGDDEFGGDDSDNSGSGGLF